jgi:3-hydroxybutyryl-CoA dehydrogenase
MKIVYTAPRHGDEGFLERCRQSGIRAIQVSHASDFVSYPDADLYIDAAFDGHFAQINGPLLFHAPAAIFAEMPLAPRNSARFCAWPGFWERDIWEIVTATEGVFSAEHILKALGIRVLPVADIAGLIAPRILCTIINEAAYTINDGIANAHDVNIAMRLGTNYPKGPAEWANEIGCNEIIAILSAMGKEDPKYLPHPNLCEAFV